MLVHVYMCHIMKEVKFYYQLMITFASFLIVNMISLLLYMNHEAYTVKVAHMYHSSKM